MVYREGNVERQCPQCGAGLAARELTASARAIACDACGGVWLEPPALAALRAADPAILTLARALPRAVTGDGAIVCPFCGALTERWILREDGAVTAFRCFEHGVWLDPGDLERAFYDTMRPSGKPDVSVLEGVFKVIARLFFPG